MADSASPSTDGPPGWVRWQRRDRFLSHSPRHWPRGARVAVRNHCRAALHHKGVDWAPLDEAVPQECDLYIGNRGHRVIGLAPGARHRLFWLHNPARYLKKPRVLWPLLRYRPTLVVTGDYHAGTVPAWIPRGGLEIIPYGILDNFRHAARREPPAPRAIFTSNPLRGLDWLLDLWVTRIALQVPGAELHIYAGPAVYGGVAGGTAHAGRMEAVLARADTHAQGAAPCAGRPGQACRIASGTRAMSIVATPARLFASRSPKASHGGAGGGSVGSVARSRRRQNRTLAVSDGRIAEAAVAVLRDDDLWRRWHGRARCSAG